MDSRRQSAMSRRPWRRPPSHGGARTRRRCGQAVEEARKRRSTARQDRRPDDSGKVATTPPSCRRQVNAGRVHEGSEPVGVASRRWQGGWRGDHQGGARGVCAIRRKGHRRSNPKAGAGRPVRRPPPPEDTPGLTPAPAGGASARARNPVPTCLSAALAHSPDGDTPISVPSGRQEAFEDRTFSPTHESPGSRG